MQAHKQLIKRTTWQDMSRENNNSLCELKSLIN